ncbi:MAG: hypothetical protein Q8787_02835, partial [Sweet potato little leaf phytoplasma]|nr:hypothetical protein [Sweet potato little leaf phytoplasma]
MTDERHAKHSSQHAKAKASRKAPAIDERDFISTVYCEPEEEISQTKMEYQAQPLVVREVAHP